MLMFIIIWKWCKYYELLRWGYSKNVRMHPDLNLFWTVWTSDKLSAVIIRLSRSRSRSAGEAFKRYVLIPLTSEQACWFFLFSFLSSLISVQVFTRWLGYLSLTRWAVFRRASSSAPWVINKRALQRRGRDGLIVRREFRLTEEANGLSLLA